MRKAYLPLLALLLTGPSVAQDKQKNSCAEAAFREFIAQKVARSENAASPNSIESEIAERRLEEQFCLRFARCLVGEATSQLLNLQLATMFSACLRDEALEKYKP
jgi:hypothetical protein